MNEKVYPRGFVKEVRRTPSGLMSSCHTWLYPDWVVKYKPNIRASGKGPLFVYPYHEGIDLDIIHYKDMVSRGYEDANFLEVWHCLVENPRKVPRMLSVFDLMTVSFLEGFWKESLVYEVVNAPNWVCDSLVLTERLWPEGDPE